MLVEADETIRTMAYTTTINGADRVVINLGDYEYVLDPKRAMNLHHDLSHVLEQFKPSDLLPNNEVRRDSSAPGGNDGH